MTHLLLITRDGSVSDEAVQTVAKRVGDSEVAVRVVVPLNPVPDAWTWDEDATRDEMLVRLGHALERLGRTGASVEGTIGCDRDAMVCVNWVMQREPVDEVIVATQRSRRARLLRMDLAARIGRAFGVPVTHLPAARHSPATA